MHKKINVDAVVCINILIPADKSEVPKINKETRRVSKAKAGPSPVAEPNSLDKNSSRTSSVTEGSFVNEITSNTTSRVGNRKRKLPSSLTNFVL